MAIKKFEDVVAWQKAQELTVAIYSTFRTSKDYSFKDQICRASISISSNIAEGFDCKSNANFSRYLDIAFGSCNETRSLLYLAQKLGYLSEDQFSILLKNANEVSKILNGLIKSIQIRKND